MKSLLAVDSFALDSHTSPFPEIQVSLPCFSSSPWFKICLRVVDVLMLLLLHRSRTQLKRRKNAPGSRKDPGWEYTTDIEGDSKKTKCKFCSKVFSGGIFRFKHHLARTKENVEPCLSVPDDVRKQMLDVLDLNLEAKEARKNLLQRGINITDVSSATGSQ
ncbi:hypothetical protein LINPERHAP1_LOCUS17501 [Linum perenne]